MPAFSRRRFQRIKVGQNVTIEVLETGKTITKLEITAPQGWRILRAERKPWEGQTMMRSSEELEKAAAKRLKITHEELLEQTHADKLADIRNPDKPTKLIIERHQWESVRIGPDIYLQLMRAGTTCRMGIERPDDMVIELLDMSQERITTETVRRRDAAHRRQQWVASGGPARMHAERKRRNAA